MAEAESSGMPELGAFSTKLRQDTEAVVAAMSMSYSWDRRKAG